MPVIIQRITKTKSRNGIKDNPYQTNHCATATISTMVQIGDVTEYLTVTKVFSKYQAFRIVFESIKSSAPTWKSEQKLQFEEFIVLADLLTNGTNYELILKNKKDLIDLPLNHWL